MKKLFVACDIEGTYDSLLTRERIELIQGLDNYAKDKYDGVIFSFISSLSCSDVVSYSKMILEPMLEEMDTIVEVGPMFGFDAYSISNNIVDDKMHNACKGVQLYNAISRNDIFFGSDTISSIMYIDDLPNINPSFLLMRAQKDHSIEKAVFIVKDDGYDIRESDYDFEVVTIKDNSDNFAIEGFREFQRLENMKKILR